MEQLLDGKVIFALSALIALFFISKWNDRRRWPIANLTPSYAFSAIKASPLIRDNDYHPGDTPIRFFNTKISILFWRFEVNGKTYENIDMAMPNVGGGGLLIAFEDGQEVAWGRLGSIVSTEPLSMENAVYAHNILTEVRLAYSSIPNSPP